MGKKTCRKKYISKGQRPNVSRSLINAVARDKNNMDRESNLVDCWIKGQNPWITIPSNLESNKPFIRVKANKLWGDPKKRVYNIFTGVKK